MNSQIRCLITGASGFAGSGVLKYFLAHTDWEFVVIASWRHHGNPMNVPRDPRVTVITHDLRGPIPEIGEFDYIIHMASESHVDDSIAQSVEIFANNVLITLEVLDYARRHKPKNVILFSTDEVYGAAHHKEWDILLPSNPYSGSKASQEMAFIAWWKTFGIPVVITNSNNIVGPNQDVRKVLPKFINLIKNNQEVVIHTSNGNPGSRYYNPVNNIANALLFIIELGNPTKYPDSDRPDRYALPGGMELDNLALAQTLAKLMDKELIYRLADAETIRPGYDQFYPEVKGRLTELGWVPPYSLEDELKELVAHYA
jgi:dTDP-glucose 4,6-dehydratase